MRHRSGPIAKAKRASARWRLVFDWAPEAQAIVHGIPIEPEERRPPDGTVNAKAASSHRQTRREPCKRGDRDRQSR
jgi:hypothetical protein